jgi:hypothetical protein
MAEHRGSRRHILDLLASPDAADQLDALLAPAAYHVVRPVECRPMGPDSAEEYTLRAFWREHCTGWVAPEALDDWWVADHYKNPTWDLLAVCERETRRGLLLVEAKAHESELDWKGKRALVADTDSAQAWVNDSSIRAAIREAHDWFAQVAGPTTLTADNHYQLANRLASAYKVASVGVPVVLLYLGFTGDTYFTDHLRDADHWDRMMRGYLHDVVPSDLPGRVLPHAAGGSLTFLAGALPVRAASRRSNQGR